MCAIRISDISNLNPVVLCAKTRWVCFFDLKVLFWIYKLRFCLKYETSILSLSLLLLGLFFTKHFVIARRCSQMTVAVVLAKVGPIMLRAPTFDRDIFYLVVPLLSSYVNIIINVWIHTVIFLFTITQVFFTKKSNERFATGRMRSDFLSILVKNKVDE